MLAIGIYSNNRYRDIVVVAWSSAVGLSPRGCPPSVGWNTLFPINFPFQKTWKPFNYITYYITPISTGHTVPTSGHRRKI